VSRAEAARALLANAVAIDDAAPAGRPLVVAEIDGRDVRLG
jgi:hypothetical protein